MSSCLVTLPGQPDNCLRLELDGQEKYFQVQENQTHYYQVFYDWTRDLSGVKKILYIAEDALKGIKFCFQKLESNFRLSEIIEGIEVAAAFLFFASVWKDIKIYGENGIEFGKAGIELVCQIAKRCFAKQENNDQITEADETSEAGEPEKPSLGSYVRKTALKGELWVYSGSLLVKDIVKVIQTVVKVPFQTLGMFLKVFSPFLDLWELRYTIAILWTHIKERRAIRAAQETRGPLDLESAEGKALALAQKVVTEKIRHDRIDIALEVIDLAMTAIGAIALWYPMPVEGEVLLGVAGFLILLAVCMNKLSQNAMSGSFEELKDQGLIDRLHGLAHSEEVDSGAGIGVA